MNRSLNIWCLAVTLALPLLARGAGERPANKTAFALVKDGVPAATIVLAAEPLASNRLAAAELQRVIRKMSGAELPIRSDADVVGGPVVLIGRSLLTAKLELDIPSGFSRELNEEGFIIKTVGDKLVLAGNDDGPRRKANPKLPYSFANTYKGSLFAVCELLERLGCRWYYPGEFGEIVPAAKTVGLPALDVKSSPSFPVRGFWYGVPAAKRKNQQLRNDMEMWMLHNKMLPYGAVLASAGDGSIMAPFRKYRYEKKEGKRIRINAMFEEQPDYFRMKKDGSRDPGYLCLANPEVLRLAAEHALNFFRQNPDANCFGYAPPDGTPTCECVPCRQHNFSLMQKRPSDPAVQDISEGFYRFLDQVARAVAKEFPDKWVTTTAYAGRIRPPDGVQLSPNISVHTAFLAHSRHHRYDFRSWQTTERMKLYERWGKISRYTVERPYFPPMQFHCHVPQPMYRASAFNIKELKRLGLAGSEWEGRCAFMAGGLNYYVRAKCLWDVDTDIDALLADYYREFFGVAAAPVQKFFEAVERAFTEAPLDHHEEERLPEIYPRDFVVRVTDGVGPIEEMAAKADPATRQRVRFARLVVDHFRAYSDMRAAEAELDFKLAVRKAREMIAQEGDIDAMHPAMIDGYAEYRDGRPFYGELGANASPHGKLKQYLAKQARIDGSKGDLVAALPVSWDFRTDPRDEGVTAQWYLPGTHEQEWRPLATTRSWEIQGLQDEALRGYNGFAWYRTSFAVDEKFKGRRIVLFVGGLNDQGWFWCNERLAGAQPLHQYWQRWLYHYELDITPLVKFGERNTLAVRVFDEQDAGGIFRRCFIYSPVDE